MPGTRQTHARPRPIHTTLAVLFGALACAFALALAPTTGSVRARRAQAPAAQAISRHQPQGTTQTTTQAVTFDSWTADSASLAKLKAFVDDVTDPSSPNYVEPADRIATFDMDGTILCEKAPIYSDYMLLLHRILDDATYEADAETRALALQIRANADKGFVDGDLDRAKNMAFAKVFAGMTHKEFAAYVNDFFTNTPVEGLSNMTYGESFYKPMLEVIDYLRANDFDVYIVTACEREVARALAGPRLDIDPSHIIGSDLAVTATGQKDEADNAYTFQLTDELTLKGEVLSDCGKFNKVVYIQREIGKRPILSFGNSSGDFAMLNYAQANPDHRGMVVLIVADDTVREYGNAEKAKGFYDEVAKCGWTAFSMGGDWSTIYGPNVTKTALNADLVADAA